MSEDGKCILEESCCDCDSSCRVVKIEELCPCPLCGKSDGLELQDSTMDDPSFSVGCRLCGLYVFSEGSFLDAASRWNTREKGSATDSRPTSGSTVPGQGPSTQTAETKEI